MLLGYLQSKNTDVVSKFLAHRRVHGDC